MTKQETFQQLRKIAARINGRRAANAADRKERDRLIKSALGLGATEQEVAKNSGVSSVRVHQIKEEGKP